MKNRSVETLLHLISLSALKSVQLFVCFHKKKLILIKCTTMSFWELFHQQSSYSSQQHYIH